MKEIKPTSLGGESPALTKKRTAENKCKRQNMQINLPIKISNVEYRNEMSFKTNFADQQIVEFEYIR